MAESFDLAVRWPSGRIVTVRVWIESALGRSLGDDLHFRLRPDRRTDDRPTYLIDNSDLASEEALFAFLRRVTTGPTTGSVVDAVCLEGRPLQQLLFLLEIEEIPKQPHAVRLPSNG